MTIDSGKIRWKCRRGMLELDITLARFYDQHFQTLTEDEKELFDYLLDQPDPSLYRWLMGFEIPDDSKIKHIVDKILS